MVAGIAHQLATAAWDFYVFGPQLVVCLLLGYFCARRGAGSRLTWLVGAFLASLLPFAGVVVMLVLWRRARPPAEPAGPPP